MKKSLITFAFLCAVLFAFGLTVQSCSKKDESAQTFTTDVPFDKGDMSTRFDPDGKISVSDAEKIKTGMTFEEVVGLIGKPKRDIGSGRIIMEWQLDFADTAVFHVFFEKVPGSLSKGEMRVTETRYDAINN